MIAKLTPNCFVLALAFFLNANFQLEAEEEEEDDDDNHICPVISLYIMNFSGLTMLSCRPLWLNEQCLGTGCT